MRQFYCGMWRKRNLINGCTIMSLLKNPKVIILIVFLIVGAIILATNGLKYGLDFSGGTQFVLTLDQEISSEQMSKVTSTIAQRLDWTGLKDVKVNSFGGKFVTAQVAISDPSEVAKTEELLQKQGRFENVYNGQILFTGDDITSVVKDASQGYGVQKQAQGYQWSLPFILKPSAAKNFAESIFHTCVTLPDNTQDCPQTYFFIDRPENALILVPDFVYAEESFTSQDPVFQSQNQVKLEEIMKNAKSEFLVVKEIDSNTIAKISALVKEKEIKKIVYHNGLDITVLKKANLEVGFIEVAKQGLNPWIWSATGLKSIIGVTPEITNDSAPTKDSAQFKVFSNLRIVGSASDLKEAQEKISTLDVILSSGSLPVGVDSISKEIVSPQLGQNILSKILLSGIVALVLVAIVLFIRYKNWKIMFPIFFTGASEVFLILAFASLIKWNLDLAALAGIIIAVGTGVDNQIIITDEMAKGEKQEEERSLLARVKRAFFIVFASMSVALATMLPVLFGFYGIGKFVGFAIVTIAGVILGVLVTRQAFAEIMKYIYAK